MKLKVGDKVRLTKQAAWSEHVGEVCVVTKLLDFDSEFICRVKYPSSGWECLMLPGEIEKVSEKGRQLEFAFMGEE